MKMLFGFLTVLFLAPAAWAAEPLDCKFTSGKEFTLDPHVWEHGEYYDTAFDAGDSMVKVVLKNGTDGGSTFLSLKLYVTPKSAKFHGQVFMAENYLTPMPPQGIDRVLVLLQSGIPGTTISAGFGIECPTPN